MGTCSTGCGSGSVYPDAQVGCANICGSQSCKSDCYQGCGSTACGGGNCTGNCARSSACVGGCISYCSGLATNNLFLYIIINNILTILKEIKL